LCFNIVATHFTGEIQLCNEKYGTLLQSDTAAPIVFNLSLDVDPEKDKKNQATVMAASNKPAPHYPC
jgi:hypothetical protein